MTPAETPLPAYSFESFDGTEIAYYLTGQRDGPTLVLCNGLGGNLVIWRELIAAFGDRFRIVCWDYRGLYGSGRPPTAADYDIPNHALDLAHLIEHLRLERPTLIGWSMGVQVSLELHRTHPELAGRLIAIHGTQGHSLSTAFDSPITKWVAPAVFTAMKGVGRRLETVGPPLARTRPVVDGLVWACQRTGMMSPDIDDRAFAALAEEWLRLDFEAYARVFEALSRHSTWDLLPEIPTPTLVIAGEADRFTPAHLAIRMAREMPNAVLRSIPGATHFGLIEYPDAIVATIEDHLAGGAGRHASRGSRRPARRTGTRHAGPR